MSLVGVLSSRGASEWQLWRGGLLLGAVAAVAVSLVALPGERERHASVHPRDAFARLPLPTKAAIARTLGRDDRSYGARRTATGFDMSNPRHRLVVRFGRGGVSVRSAAARFGLSLRALGYGERLQPPAAVDPQARANRVFYRRARLTEWYANGPLGLEQGFTLTAPPTGRGAGPLTLALALSGNLPPSLGSDGLRLGAGRRSLRYSGLFASDARGRRLPTRLELRGRTLLLRVDDRGARYPLLVDPFIQQAKLTASDGAALDHLGFSVAVSGDTVVVGAPNDDMFGHADVGSAYVFVKPASGWASASQAAKLTASDGAGQDELGVSVAISGDTIVAGAPLDNPGANFVQGSAYVFVKPAGGWANATETAKLTASDGAAEDELGDSVAVSGDTVVAGAFNDDVGANSAQGSAYVFVKPAGGWADSTETAKLTASSGAAFDQLGPVAASGDTVVAGAANRTVGGNGFQGSAYVFVKPASGWTNATETAELTASDGVANALLGGSVAVSGDIVVAGARGDNSAKGSAYVFVKPASGWASTTEAAKLTASDGAAGDTLGISVAASGDTVVAGASPDNVGANADQGSAYVFVKPASGWASATETAKLTASDGGAFDFLGGSVAVSGATLVAGAFGDDVGANADQGSAYVFVNVVNQSPSCTGVAASPDVMSPATRDQMKLISLSGATDPDGDPLSYHIDGVSQDEPVTAQGDDTSPDAGLTSAGASSNQLLVRAERNPQLNGRVYRIAYTVSDGKGASCSRTAGVGGNTNAKVAFPRKKDETAVDDGDTSSWNSFTGAALSGTLP